MADTNDGSAPGSIACLGRDPALAEGYASLERADWQGALDFFREASKNGSAKALEGLGMTAWVLKDEAALFEAREQAFEAYRSAGDMLGAGRLAVLIAEDSAVLRGQVALANGWIQRARRCLEGLPAKPEHGWLAYLEAEKALYLDDDVLTAQEGAAQATVIARRTGDVSLEVSALSFEGLVMVYRGEVAEGLSKLDEAATACVTGEVREPWIISATLCTMMEACDKVRDWDRANEWFGHVRDLASRWNDSQFYAQCRPHYAVILTWRGAWREAEDELRQTIDTFREKLRPMAVEGLTRLAELRLRQGRLDEAAALFEEVQHESIAQPGQALLALERLQPGPAFELAERFLRRLPQSNRVQRMQALEVFIRACIAKGELGLARDALPELEEIARSVSTRAVQAASHLTQGLIVAAEGDFDDARKQLEDAIDLYDAGNAPFEAARARTELARVLRGLGRGVEATSQAEMACEALQRLGAVGEALKAQALLQVGTDIATPAVRLPEGLSQREVEVLALLAGGLSNQEIADRLVLSIRTVQRHVENIYAKTGARGRAAAAVFAATHNIVPPGLHT